MPLAWFDSDARIQVEQFVERFDRNRAIYGGVWTTKAAKWTKSAKGITTRKGREARKAGVLGRELAFFAPFVFFRGSRGPWVW